MKPLVKLLAPCGPVVDRAAADRLRDILLEDAGAHGWGDLLEEGWARLAPTFAASPYLASLVRRDPHRLRRVLRADPHRLAHAIAKAARRAAGDRAAVEKRLRGLKADVHLLTGLADVGGVFDVADVTGALSRFADGALAAALAVAAREAASAGLIRPGDDEHGPVRGLFILAMGKLGAFELNYSSDIDIIVFHDPDALRLTPDSETEAIAVRIVERVAEILSRRTSDGYVFRVDLRLRPDPSSTSTSVSLPAAYEYYESVGQNWERAAFIKARPAAGDLPLAAHFLREIQPFVWRRNLDFGAIADIHAIRRQIHGHDEDGPLAAPGADLKLGRGGIREIEFYVQTQQLILGGRHPELRCPATIDALAALRAGRHAPDKATRDLASAYTELRRLEHRVQMVADEQTHRLPKLAGDRRAIAVMSRVDRLARFDARVAALLTSVHGRYVEMFAGEEAASSRFGSLSFTGPDHDPDTLKTLARMGFSDPIAVSQEIRGWGHGHIAATRTERGREIFNRLAPRLLDACVATGAPGVAFDRFADFFRRLSHGVQVQSLLVAKPYLLDRIVRIMTLAPRLARTLARRPAALDALLGPGVIEPPEDRSALSLAIASAAGFEDAMNEARRLHRDASFEISIGVLERMIGADAAGRAFAALADAIIQGLATASLAEVERRAGALAGEVAVIALGRCGSAEMNVDSDLDLMTLYHAAPDTLSGAAGWDAGVYFTRFTQRLLAALSAQTAEGELYAVDLQLRPSGTKGPVAVSLAAFTSYYASEAEVWELMAITRARVVWATSPHFADTARSALDAALRRPRDRSQTARDALAMRDLMRRERPASSVWDMKLATGGLVDIEFCAQYLQLIGAAEGGPLRHGTLDALDALAAAGAAPAATLGVLSTAFSLQQDLVQLLKLALTDGDDPAAQPSGLKELIAQAARTRRFQEVKTLLARTREKVARAYAEVIVP